MSSLILVIGLAILNPRDQLHERAKSASARLRQQVAQVIQSIQREPNLRLVEQTRVLFQDALALYRSRLDKQLNVGILARAEGLSAFLDRFALPRAPDPDAVILRFT